MCHRVQVIPVNANGVPIGEIPFVRSGLLGFVGPVSRTVSLQYNICGNLSPPGSHPALTLSLNGSVCSQYIDPLVYPPLRAGQPDLCGGEDRGSADGERAETQRRRPGGHRSRRGASQDCVPREVRRPPNSFYSKCV